MEQTGRVAIVTGGARGIGAAIAAELAGAGMRVAVWDRDGASAKATGAEIDGLGLRVDVTDRVGVEAGLAEVEDQLGPVDVLVNNAGIDIISAFTASKEEDWERIVAVNFMGTVRCCHLVVPGMLERRQGVIVNIASDAGKVGSSGEAVYSGTKGGVIAFSKALAREVARAGVRVNAVCPGPVDTALLGEVAAASPRLLEGLVRAVPMRRIGQPGDIAPAVAFLASDAAGYITGQALSVDGGLTMM